MSQNCRASCLPIQADLKLQFWQPGKDGSMKWTAGVRSGALLFLALAPSLARAAPARADQTTNFAAADDELPRAKSLFTQGQREYNLGHYPEALALFEQAYKIKPLPELLYNIGQCHRLLGNLEQARRVYQNFLYAVPDSPHAEAAAEKLHELDEALKAQAEARTSLPTTIAGPERPAAVAGSLDKAVQDTMKADVPAAHPTTGGGSLPVSASGSPRTSAPLVAVEVRAAPVTNSHSARVAGWSLIGASVVVAGAGTIFGLGAKSADADWAAATTQQSWQSARNSAQSKATLATISWVAAGVLAAGGLATLLFLDR